MTDLLVIVFVVLAPWLPIGAVPVASISYVLGAEVRLGFDIPVILLAATEGLEQLRPDFDGTVADGARVDRITPAEEGAGLGVGECRSGERARPDRGPRGRRDHACNQRRIE